MIVAFKHDICCSVNLGKRPFGIGSDESHDMCSVRCSTVYPENLSGDAPNWGPSNYDDDDMCQIDDEEDFFSNVSIKHSSTSLSADVNKVIKCLSILSFNLIAFLIQL